MFSYILGSMKERRHADERVGCVFKPARTTHFGITFREITYGLSSLLRAYHGEWKQANTNKFRKNRNAQNMNPIFYNMPKRKEQPTTGGKADGPPKKKNQNQEGNAPDYTHKPDPIVRVIAQEPGSSSGTICVAVGPHIRLLNCR